MGVGRERARGSLRGAEGEADADGRALPFLALHLDRPAVAGDDVPHGEQAEPAAGDGVAGVGGAVVGLEDALQVGGGDADAVVGDTDGGLGGLGAAIEGDGDGDVPSVRAVLDGVPDLR